MPAPISGPNLTYQHISKALTTIHITTISIHFRCSWCLTSTSTITNPQKCGEKSPNIHQSELQCQGACGRRRCRSAEVLWCAAGVSPQQLQPHSLVETGAAAISAAASTFHSWKPAAKASKAASPVEGLGEKVRVNCNENSQNIAFSPETAWATWWFFWYIFFGFIRLFVDRDGKVWERSIRHSLSCPSGGKKRPSVAVSIMSQPNTSKHIRSFYVLHKEYQTMSPR